MEIDKLPDLPDHSGPMWAIYNCGSEIHVIRIKEIHMFSRYCFCSPHFTNKDPYNGREIWTHNEAS